MPRRNLEIQVSRSRTTPSGPQQLPTEQLFQPVGSLTFKILRATKKQLLWTPILRGKPFTNLNKKLRSFLISYLIRDEVERTTTGNVKNFFQALREAELPEIREKLKNKFAVVDASQIKAWEALLRNSIRNSTDKVFTEGLDMEKQFRDLEKLQNYLYNICPTQYQESYVLGTKQALAEIVQERLHQEYYEDAKDCVATKAK
jgi:hypothetical protein